ncbi:3-dehydro-bile acid delta(4,6)-reductase [Sesamum angolense]|uniref:3-dehydro-bile acid delta(4,6)-reductase n=1 Tax=Sesamum angolense TaxID=2727404 RepID=A0AAE1XEF1_9LAMI|nr:3-dehydro-bile acid delta(4,6)-reductase [Sesamum angolense]
MNAFPRLVLHNEILSKISTPSRNYAYFLSSNHRRKYCAVTLSLSTKVRISGGGRCNVTNGHCIDNVKQRVINSFPSELGLVKRFWRYILEYEDFVDDLSWASISNNLLIAIASRLKNCCFRVKGKGQFKDEFVTAGGVPLSEISLNTMQSRIKSHLFFAGEVLNVDGVTGGFNFQNAWSGGYIAGTSIGNLATATYLKEEAV